MGLATTYIVLVVHADRPVAVLSALVVTEEERRKGVGRQLVEAAHAWARDRRAYRITVMALENIEGATSSTFRIVGAIRLGGPPAR